MTIYAYVTFFAETPLEHIKNQKKKKSKQLQQWNE